MLDRLRKHLQTWLNVPSDLTPHLDSLHTRILTLERRSRHVDETTMPTDTPSSPSDRRELSAVPDAHLGAH